jgi:hypothetical protein
MISQVKGALRSIPGNVKKAILISLAVFFAFDLLFFGFLGSAFDKAGNYKVHFKYSRLPGRPKTKPKIAIVTYFTSDNYGTDLRKLTWSNKQKFAAERGYDIYDANAVPSIAQKIAESREKMHNFFFFKYLAMYELLQGGEATGGKVYDYIIWSDADAIYLNWGKRYEDIIDERFDIIVATGPPDHPQWGNIVNCGSLIVRNSEFGLQFLDDVLHMSKNHCGEFLLETPEAGTAINGWLQVCNPDGGYWLSDQGIVQALFTFKNPEYRCHFKKTWFRAFNSEFPWYADGDMVVHFPGRGIEERKKLIKAFEKYTNFRNGKIDHRYSDILDNDDSLTSDLGKLEEIYAEQNQLCGA